MLVVSPLFTHMTSLMSQKLSLDVAIDHPEFNHDQPSSDQKISEAAQLIINTEIVDLVKRFSEENIKAIILGYTQEGTNDYVVMRLLSSNKSIQAYAKLRLKELNIYNLPDRMKMTLTRTTPEEYLLEHTCQLMIAKCSKEEKSQIVCYAAQQDHNILINEAHRSTEKMLNIASIIFNDTIVRCTLSLITMYYTYKIVNLTQQYVMASPLVPKMINKMINSTPVLIIRVANITFDFIQTCYRRRFSISISLIVIDLAASCFMGRNSFIARTTTLIYKIFEKTVDTIRYCTDLPIRIAMSVAYRCFNDLVKASKLMKDSGDFISNYRIVRGLASAQKLWVKEMQTLTSAPSKIISYAL